MAEENVEAVEETVSVENASSETEADAKTQESEAEPTPAVEADKEKANLDATGNAVGKRIKTLTDKVRSGQQKHDSAMLEARQENERLQKELDSRPKTQEPLKTLEDFDFDETKHRTYLDERTATIAENAASSAVSKVQTQLASGQIEQGFRAREKTFESEVDDYSESVYGLDANGQRKWANNDEMTAEFMRSEIGPEMIYHLSKNTELSVEIEALSPRETIRRMTLLEADLKSEKAKTGNSVSNAPPPTPKIPAGDAGLAKKIDDPGLSTKEFAKMRREQIANR